MHPPQHSHADPPPADPDLLRFSSTQPDLTGICACRVAGIEKEGRNCEPGTGAGKWDGSRFPVPILSHSSALFFSPAAPQMRSRSRPSVLSHRPDQRINIVNLMPSHILFDTANRFNSRIRIKEIRRPNRNRRSPRQNKLQRILRRRNTAHTNNRHFHCLRHLIHHPHRRLPQPAPSP